MEPFAHRAINRRREKLWNERCEPGHLPCLSLPSAMIGFLLGIGFSVILWTFVRTVATDATDAAQANKETPTPNPVEAWMEDVDENKNPGWSEAGIDPHANPEQAEKLRHETEQRLDPIDDEEEDAPK